MNTRFPSSPLLKIDTEGYDLEVLRGAARMLKAGSIGAVLIECSIAPTSPRHQALTTIHDHLAPYGFQFFSLCEATSIPPNGQHWFCNALFKQASVLSQPH